MRFAQLLPGLALVALATPLPALAQAASSVEAEIVIAASVQDREPVDPGTSFPADIGKVTAWTRVTGAANTTIEHVWKHGDLEFVVPLEIGGSPWRTWSTKNIPPEWAGEWTVEVRDANGTVVASATFTVGG